MKTLFDSPTTDAAQIGGAGTLNAQDVAELNAATKKVLALMLDGAWHTREEICAACGQIEGLRRLRELRREYVIEKERVGEARVWRYRISKAVKREP